VFSNDFFVKLDCVGMSEVFLALGGGALNFETKWLRGQWVAIDPMSGTVATMTNGKPVPVEFSRDLPTGNFIEEGTGMLLRAIFHLPTTDSGRGGEGCHGGEFFP